MKQLARLVGLSSSISLWLALAQNTFAQVSTSSASKGGVGGGGTSGALPNAGSTELTYIIFIGGLALFVFGTLKLILSFRDSG